MAQQNEKQPKAKTGLARCLELASGHKGLVFLAGFLAALAAICSFVPYLSIYYIIREILFVYPDMSLLNVSTISTWGWLALAGILGNIVFYFFALLCSHVAAFGTLYELKVAFADHIMHIPLGYHLTLGSGKMRKIMDENIESVEKFIAHQLPDFVASLVAPLVLVIILLGIDWRYGVVCLVGIVLAFIVQFAGFNGEAKEKMHRFQTAQENNSPVILGVSEGAGKYMGGYTTIVGMVNGMLEELNITVPVALHLDHGSYEAAKECIAKGFSSVMFDGSKYGIEENIEKTKEIVALAHSKGISVEAEVGAIGGEEDGVLGGGEIADPNECASICELGVDMLAAGIGNIHGVYPENWAGLRLDVLAQIQEKTGTMPLVLHGGTGIPDEMVKDAISKGVSKINVNTECQIVFTAAVRKYFEENLDQQKKGFDPRKVLKPGVEAIKAKVKEKMELFGSIDKA